MIPCFFCSRSWLWALAGAAALLLSACGGGASGHAACDPHLPAPAASGSIAAVVDGLIEAEMLSQGAPSMTVEIARNGVPVYVQSYGQADLERCLAARPATAYEIGSLTKQITAAAVLQLNAAGRIGLDDAVSRYLPKYGFANAITVRMLLNQTSGLPDYTQVSTPPQGAISVEQVLTAITVKAPDFAPGTAWEYSNSNYYVLGVLIELVSGQSYENYLAAHVFAPAGMLATGLSRPATSALPYAVDTTPGAKQPSPGVILDPSVFFSAGALWSTVGDLTKWNQALLSGLILAPAQLDLMVTPVGLPIWGGSGATSPYAMGWSVTTVNGHPFVWHNGQTLAYSAFNGVFPESGWSVSILTNLAETTTVTPLAKNIVSRVCAVATGSRSCY